MADPYCFNLADESPLEFWNSPEGETPSEQQPSHDTAQDDDEPDIELEQSTQSAASQSRTSSQPQIMLPERTIEGQNGGIPALQAATASSTPGRADPRMLGLPSSQREIYDNDESDAQPVDDHGQRTEPPTAESNSDIEEKDVKLLRVCFEENPDPSFKHKKGLASVLHLEVELIDNWYRKQRLARLGSVPYIRVSSFSGDVPVEDDGEAWLNYCFDKNSDPLYKDKERLAKIRGTTVEDIDEWHRSKRLASQEYPSLSHLNPGSQLASSQTDGIGQRQVDDMAIANENRNTTNKRNRSRSTASVLTSPASATFSQPSRLGLDARSESSQTTATGSSSQSKTPRFKCTFPDCPRAGKSIGDQVRHEYEVHWRESYFPCVLCSIDLTANGLFKCTFCGYVFQELVAIERHVLGPCDLPKAVEESHHRRAHAKDHQKKHHPSTSEVEVEGQSYLKCCFCPKRFNRNDDPDDHSCKKKDRWKRKQELKALFEAEGEHTIWSEKGLEGWTFCIEGGYPFPWPRECSHPTCTETFDGLKERAIHFDSAHYVPSPTRLKRGFSDSGIDYDGEDDDGTRTENSQQDHRSQYGSSTTERRWRRRHPAQRPVQLTQEERRMDLVGVVDERLPTNPP